MSCVYLATNKVNGKQYVGKTVRSLADRRKAHERSAFKGSMLPFHCALRKYGLDVFEWIEVEEIEDEEDLIKAEIESIAWFGSKAPKGYNLTDGGDGGRGSGFHHTPETIAKVSAGNKGKVRSAEFKAKVGDFWRGKKRSESNVAKLRAANLGKKHSAETREKIGLVQRGRKQSPELIAKRAAALMGRVVTDDTRGKISRALTANGSANLKEASVRNRAKRVEALKRFNRWRDWEACSASP